MAILVRWAVAFALVAATFNPTPYNYFRWATSDGAQLSFVALGGLVLLVGYVIYLRATLRSIGAFGMLLVAAFVGALLWAAADLGWLALDDPGLNTWIAIAALSLVLGVGLSWSIIRRRISGQADVDDVEE